MEKGSSVFRDKRVVVVGSGFAGGQAAKLLQGTCHLTVIDPREYFHYCVGALRASVEPGFEKKILIPLATAWGDSFKQGKVTSINPEKKLVVLENGEEIAYDFLVIATGTSGPFPGKIDLNILTIAEATKCYVDEQQKIVGASKITIIGAGAVGVEMAGEIATDFPDKKVTIVSGGSNVVQGSFKECLRDKIKKQLNDLGVKLLLGERVTNMDEIPRDGSSSCTVKTDKGTEISADLVIFSTGLHTNSEAYQDSLGDKMDEHKNLKVNKYLQVEGHDDIFAVGDCNNADEVKMAFKAKNQSELLVNNLKALTKNCRLKAYEEVNGLILVSLGRNGGASQIKALTFGGFVTKSLKSKSMFVEKTWPTYNQKVPAVSKEDH